MQRFIIPGRLPGYNQLKGSCWQQSMGIKRKAMQEVQIHAAIAKLKPVSGKVTVAITCYEKDNRRDDDNVMFGASKIILDALQGMGVLKNDNRKCVKHIPHPVQVDRKNPRIEVEIDEIGEEISV